jgi:dienelactone hydrolase
MSFRERVLGCIGKMPTIPDLNPEIVSSVDKGDYNLVTVRYNVESDDRVESYLLVPKNTRGKTAGIIASHGHGGKYYVGKSQLAGLTRDTNMHYGVKLCRRGYVVLCPDHLVFESRRPPEFKRVETPDLDRSRYEQQVFFKLYSEGSSLLAKYISDLCRGVDFLQTLDYVDSERIGAIGHSMGGNAVTWLTWYDKRIKAGVCSCGISQIKTYYPNGVTHSFSYYAHGLLEFADIADIVADITPRAFMMINGDEDELFPMDGVREISEKASLAYKARNAGGNFKSIVFKGGHVFLEEMQEEAFKWLDTHLSR